MIYKCSVGTVASNPFIIAVSDEALEYRRNEGGWKMPNIRMADALQQSRPDTISELSLVNCKKKL